MEELIKEIKEGMKNSKKDYDDYILMNSHYKAEIISPKNFHELKEGGKKEDRTDKENKNLAMTFIDGGNTILFNSAESCIGFIKICAVTYKNNKRIDRRSKEFYAISKIHDKKLIVKTFPKQSFDELRFNPEDELLRSGIENANPERIISVIRRFAEIEFATEMNTINNNIHPNIIILDGTL